MMGSFPDDADLQSWRQAYRATQAPGSPACPTDDQLIAMVLNERHGEDRERLADHIVRCQRCTAAYQRLLRLHRAATEALPEAPPETENSP